MDIKQKNKIIDVASDTFAGAASATIGLIATGPLGAIGGALIAPALSTTIKAFAKRMLSEKESNRVKNTFSNAIDKIQIKLQQGEYPRNDNFWTSDNSDSSSAQKLLEGTLLKSRDEYEEKKLTYYSNLLVNICFNVDISFEKANILLKIIEQLSYRQLVVIAYLSDGKIIDMDEWDISFKDKPFLEKYFDFYSEMINLYDLRLLKQAGKGLKLGSAKSQLSTLGQSLSALMELNSIPDEEQNKMNILINDIQLLIKQK